MKRPVDPELVLARNAKKAGISKEEYLRMRIEAVKRSAASQGWRPAELAMHLADIEQLAIKVWKK